MIIYINYYQTINFDIFIYLVYYYLIIAKINDVYIYQTCGVFLSFYTGKPSFVISAIID